MRIVLPFVLLAAVLIATMLAERPRPRADLTLGYVSIETLDPQVTRASEDVRMAYAMFEGLYTFDEDFSVVPGVAASHMVSEDGTAYTFTLRDGAVWSDGTPITTRDFARSWMYGMLIDTAPPYIEFFHFIKGGHDFTQWSMDSLKEVQAIEDTTEKRAAAERRVEKMPEKFDELVGVRTPDDKTIVVEVERPTPYFLEICSTWPLFPLPLHVVEPLMTIHPASSMLRRDRQWVKPDNEPRTMVSNGPYTLESWEFKEAIRLAANKRYWDYDAASPQTIELRSFTTPESMFNSYAAGDLDLALGVVPKYKPELVKASVDGKRNDVHPFNAYGVYYYEFNCRPTYKGKPNRFADARVRRAFSMAVDKKAITEKVTRLYQETAPSLVPPESIKGYEGPKGLPYDVDRARQELAAAGYGPENPFGEVLVTWNTGGGHETTAQAIMKMWLNAFGDEFGVSFTTYQQEFKVILEQKTLGEFEVVRAGWFGDYMDPTTFLDLLKTGNGSNTGEFSDAKYDAMLAEAANTLDAEKRLELLEEAERYVMEEQAALLPLYYYNVVHVYDPDRLSGVTSHPRNLQLLHRIRIKKP